MNTVILIVLCLCGFLLHLFMKWGEDSRKQKRGLLAFVKSEMAFWLASLAGTVACMVMLADLPQLLNLPTDSKGVQAVLKVLALGAGYGGSSLVVTILKTLPFTRDLAGPKQDQEPK